MNEIRVLFVEPDKEPCVKEIPDTLEAFQKEVGGYIQAIYPFKESVALVCNEEGKLFGLPPNRLLRDNDCGVVYDIISGNFVIVGVNGDRFISLTEEQVDKYRSMYSIN